MSNLAWGPTKSWSWNGLRKDEGYYNKYKLEYWENSERHPRSWSFSIHGLGSQSTNPFKAAFRAYRFYKESQAKSKAWHNR